MRFKYMGTADRRAFLTGDSMNGQMKFPLPRPIIFDWSNHHIQDSEAPENKDIPLSFWEAMKKEPGFRMIDNDEVVPYNDAERLWLGRRDPMDSRFRNANPGIVDGQEVQGVETPAVQLNEEFPTIISYDLPNEQSAELDALDDLDRIRTVADANAAAPHEEVATEDSSE